MIPDGHRDLLEGRGFAHVATIGPDGEPQSPYHQPGGRRLVVPVEPEHTTMMGGG